MEISLNADLSRAPLVRLVIGHRKHRVMHLFDSAVYDIGCDQPIRGLDARGNSYNPAEALTADGAA